jgi:hypothetical protein
MNQMNQIIGWSKGNTGAMVFLMQLIDPENFKHALPILHKLEQCTSIRGTNLYVLYSDLCNKNLAVVEKLCKDCPSETLEDACSRQDYSGLALIAPYLH